MAAVVPVLGDGVLVTALAPELVDGDGVLVAAGKMESIEADVSRGFSGAILKISSSKSKTFFVAADGEAVLGTGLGELTLAPGLLTGELIASGKIESIEAETFTAAFGLSCGMLKMSSSKSNTFFGVGAGEVTVGTTGEG